MDHSESQGAPFDVVCPDDPMSTYGEGTADDPCSPLGERHIGRMHPMTSECSSFAHFYSTLVADGAVPAGFLTEFLKLEGPARRAAQRAQQKYTAISEATAEMELVRAKKTQLVKSDAERTMADQLLMLADWKPRRFRTKWQKLAYEGPTARRDAEQDLRSKYVRILAELLRFTDTPIKKLLREEPKNAELIGAGRRASTVRSRVRILQKFWSWLAASYGLNFPSNRKQLTEYMQIRLSSRVYAEP